MTAGLRPRPPGLRRWWRVAATGAAAVGLLALGPSLLRGPAFVERIAIVNASPYDIGVEVTDADRDGWTSVTTAGSGATSFGLEVVDQGPVWIFRFRSQGRDGGELRTTRDELRDRRWSVEVPAEVSDRLRRAGVSPTPYADLGGG